MPEEMNLNPEQPQPQPEQPQQTTGGVLHTEREAQLEKELEELRTKYTTALEENKKLYRRMTGSDHEELTYDERVREMMDEVVSTFHAPAVERMNLPKPVKYTGMKE